MIVIEKSSLNQSATQSLRLFEQTPFILYDFKDQLAPIWDCISSLQKIIQIISSTTIRKSDVVNLRKYIDEHCACMRKYFKIKLLPKHHNLTHYPLTINDMGSVDRLKTIRFEAKHQQFKQFAKTTKNFKDINQTLAKKHQKWMSRKTKAFSMHSIVETGKKLKSSLKVNGVLENFDCDQSEIDLFEIKWLKQDNYVFKLGSIFLHENTLYEVTKLFILNSKYLIYCSTYRFTDKCEFTNSFKIEKFNPDVMRTIDLSTIHNYKIYTKVNVKGQGHVIAEDLEIENAYLLTQ